MILTDTGPLIALLDKRDDHHQPCLEALNRLPAEFYDKMARVLDDPEHSMDEERVILLGMSQRMRLLIVCHAFYAHEQIIRIISARKATKTEQRQYTHYYT